MTRSFARTRPGALIWAAVFALGLAGPLPLSSGGPPSIVAPARADTTVSIDVFYDELSPYGSWVSHGEYGYVWVPAEVGEGWRPYTHGHWVHTEEYGWYWESEEPFAWAVYHYGRWGYEPAYGWFWVPGDTWAPAWVTWRRGERHVGWAPVAPEGHGYAYGTAAEYRPPVVEAWVFVPVERVTVVEIRRYVVPVREVARVLPQAPTVVNVKVENNIVVNRPIGRDELRRIAGHELVERRVILVDNRQAAVSARAEGRDQAIAVFRPRVEKAAAEAKPEKVVDSPNELRHKPLLRETAAKVPAAERRGVPSAAELARGRAGQDVTGGGRTGTEARPENRPETQGKAEPPATGRGEAEQPGVAPERQRQARQPEASRERQGKAAEQRRNGKPAGQARAVEPDRDKDARKSDQRAVAPDAGPRGAARTPQAERQRKQEMRAAEPTRKREKGATRIPGAQDMPGHEQAPQRARGSERQDMPDTAPRHQRPGGQ